jgi:hypothetical protein
MSKQSFMKRFASMVTEQEAFDCYRRLEKPTAAAVAEHFAKLDRNLSSSQVEKWASDGEWESRVDLGSAILVLHPDQLQGLAHRLGIRLAAVIDQLEIKTVSEFARLCDVMLKLEKACLQPGSVADKSRGSRDGNATFHPTFPPFEIVKRDEE